MFDDDADSLDWGNDIDDLDTGYWGNLFAGPDENEIDARRRWLAKYEDESFESSQWLLRAARAKCADPPQTVCNAPVSNPQPNPAAPVSNPQPNPAAPVSNPQPNPAAPAQKPLTRKEAEEMAAAAVFDDPGRRAFWCE